MACDLVTSPGNAYYTFEWEGDLDQNVLAYRVRGTLSECVNSTQPDLSNFNVGFLCPPDIFAGHQMLATIQYFLDGEEFGDPVFAVVEIENGTLKFERQQDPGEGLDFVLKSRACVEEENDATNEALITFQLPDGPMYKLCPVDLSWEGGGMPRRVESCENCICGVCCVAKG
ncbi:hypothetical protein [Alkalihalobacterium elongatum]|uniref:hypothetical protein n=1 Tax=Alkalihalobacterium elongatum TaxID=2675466 RepID=UPI001C1FDFAA|nr:hypothetical protein [Alkalihalobacterium elongatum]